MCIGPGGDPIRNPLVLPTGKNMHGLDPQSIPTSAACVSAKIVVDRLLERQVNYASLIYIFLQYYSIYKIVVDRLLEREVNYASLIYICLQYYIIYKIVVDRLLERQVSDASLNIDVYNTIVYTKSSSTGSSSAR